MRAKMAARTRGSAPLVRPTMRRLSDESKGGKGVPPSGATSSSRAFLTFVIVCVVLYAAVFQFHLFNVGSGETALMYVVFVIPAVALALSVSAVAVSSRVHAFVQAWVLSLQNARKRQHLLKYTEQVCMAHPYRYCAHELVDLMPKLCDELQIVMTLSGSEVRQIWDDACQRCMPYLRKCDRTFDAAHVGKVAAASDDVGAAASGDTAAAAEGDDDSDSDDVERSDRSERNREKRRNRQAKAARKKELDQQLEREERERKAKEKARKKEEKRLADERRREEEKQRKLEEDNMPSFEEVLREEREAMLKEALSRSQGGMHVDDGSDSDFETLPVERRERSGSDKVAADPLPRTVKQTKVQATVASPTAPHGASAPSSTPNGAAVDGGTTQPKRSNGKDGSNNKVPPQQNAKSTKAAIASKPGNAAAAASPAGSKVSAPAAANTAVSAQDKRESDEKERASAPKAVPKVRETPATASKIEPPSQSGTGSDKHQQRVGGSNNTGSRPNSQQQPQQQQHLHRPALDHSLSNSSIDSSASNASTGQNAPFGGPVVGSSGMNTNSNAFKPQQQSPLSLGGGNSNQPTSVDVSLWSSLAWTPDTTTTGKSSAVVGSGFSASASSYMPAQHHHLNKPQQHQGSASLGGHGASWGTTGAEGASVGSSSGTTSTTSGGSSAWSSLGSDSGLSGVAAAAAAAPSTSSGWDAFPGPSNAIVTPVPVNSRLAGSHAPPPPGLGDNSGSVINDPFAAPPTSEPLLGAPGSGKSSEGGSSRLARWTAAGTNDNSGTDNDPLNTSGGSYSLF